LFIHLELKRSNALEEFYFSRFIFSARCKTKISLPPYSGSTLRGGFGHAFRRIVCALKGKECTGCLLRDRCIYAYVFETPVPEDAQMMRKYTVAPHPFILEPAPDSQRTCEEGEALSFGLTLIGRATDYLPYFIYALDELGRIGIGKGRGKYELREVFEENPLKDEDTSKTLIYKGDDKMLRQPDNPVRWSDIVMEHPIPPPVMRISFITPVRIKYQNRLAKDLEFHVLFRNLLRRISLLSYFHCGHRLDDREFKDLIEQARKVKIGKRILYWHDWERWSNRQETRMKLGGFMGEITYEGDFEPFWPYIRLGEYVHVGKGSSFGLGRYRIV
jgi:CRISPR-associated endoribonuclease Cas6